jgi:hypothetical protein
MTQAVTLAQYHGIIYNVVKPNAVMRVPAS